MCVEVIVCNVSVVFLRHSVYFLVHCLEVPPNYIWYFLLTRYY